MSWSRDRLSMWPIRPVVPSLDCTLESPDELQVSLEPGYDLQEF